MKKIFCIFCFLLISSTSYAEEPITECPYGSAITFESPVIITEASSCPSDYVALSVSFNICVLGDNKGNCLMYATANTRYKDTIGTYLYTENCPLE